FRIAKMLFEELIPGFGGAESHFFVDILLDERAEEPELTSLQGQKLLAGRREFAVAEGFQVAAIGLIDTMGQVELDNAGFQDSSAAGRLGGQFRRGRRRLGGVESRDRRQSKNR